MKRKSFKKTEWTIIICCFLLVLIGLIALYSATQNSDLEEFKKQIIWIIIGIPITIIVIKIDYEIIAKFSWIPYGIFIVLLIIVLFTSAVNGATSWFNIGGASLQPRRISQSFCNNICKYGASKNTKWK